jgi:hypothetical protein
VVADAAPAAGIATVFITGSTDAVTTIEYERGAVADFDTLLERLAPRDADYRPTTRAHRGLGGGCGSLTREAELVARHRGPDGDGQGPWRATAVAMWERCGRGVRMALVGEGGHWGIKGPRRGPCCHRCRG